MGRYSIITDNVAIRPALHFRVSVGIGQTFCTIMARCRNVLPIISLGWIAYKEAIVDGIWAFANENKGHGRSGIVQIRVLVKILRSHASNAGPTSTRHYGS